MLPLSLHRRCDYETEYSSKLGNGAIRQLLTRLENGDEVYREATRKFAFHIYEQFLEKHKKTIFVDKTPRYYYILEWLVENFPDAKYITLLRHPLDVYVSIRNTFFKSSDEAVAKSTRDHIVGPKKMVGFLKQKVKNRHIVRYEDLVKDPSATVEEICKFVGVEFEPGMINYGEHKHYNGFGCPKINKNKKPHADSVDKWKREINQRVRNKLISDIKPGIFKKMGYNYE
jgi:hypothetical protein